MNNKIILILTLVAILLFSSCSVINRDDIVITNGDGDSITGKELNNELNDKSSDLSKALGELKGELKDHMDERSSYDEISQDMYGMTYDELVKSDETGIKPLSVVTEASRRNDKARGKKDNYFVPGPVLKKAIPKSPRDLILLDSYNCKYNPDDMFEERDTCTMQYHTADPNDLKPGAEYYQLSYELSDMFGVSAGMFNADFLKQSTIDDTIESTQSLIDNDGYFKINVGDNGDFAACTFEVNNFSCIGFYSTLYVTMNGLYNSQDKNYVQESMDLLDFDLLDKSIDAYTAGWNKDEYPLTI